MAHLFCDGVDAYGVIGDMARKGWQGGSGSATLPAGLALAAGGGLYGGNAIQIPANNSFVVALKFGVFTYALGATLNAAFGFKQSAPPPGNPITASNHDGLLMLSSGTPAAASNNTMVTCTTAGLIRVAAYGTITALATGTHNVCDGNYHWIEIQYVFNTAATGSVQVYVDGVLDINVSSVATVISGTPTGGVGVGSVINSSGGAVLTTTYDDIIFWDNTGSAFNTFPLGQQRISTLVPSAAGDLTQFTPSTGSNFSVAAQAYAGSATLTASAAGETDLYDTAGLGSFAPTTINAVVVNSYAEDPSAGGLSTVAGKVKSSGTVVSGAASPILTSTLQTYQDAFYADSTGAAWIPSSVNAAQIGMGS